jgi:hypothetical protein
MPCPRRFRFFCSFGRMPMMVDYDLPDPDMTFPPAPTLVMTKSYSVRGSSSGSGGERGGGSPTRVSSRPPPLAPAR